MARLEIHVPISPTPIFFNRIHYLLASLAEYGGPVRDARVVVTVGDDSEPWDLGAANPWSRRYPVEWRWLARAEYRKYSYWATRLERFRHPYDADTILLLDPDVLLTGSIEGLVERVEGSARFHGSPAHVTPVRGDFTWERLFEAARLGAVPYQCEHTGFGIMFTDPERRFCPPYFNLGVLAGPRSIMETIGSTVFDELALVFPIEDFFRAQMSLTLAIVRNEVPWSLLPLRYNFPNDPGFVARYPEEFERMSLCHYLRKHQFDKDADLGSPEAVSALMARPGLDAPNRHFFERLRPVHARVLRDLEEES